MSDSMSDIVASVGAAGCVNVAAPQADRPDMARALLEGAGNLDLDVRDPRVLASTTDGFRVRRDVLVASGLADTDADTDRGRADDIGGGTGQPSGGASGQPGGAATQKPAKTASGKKE